MYRVGGHITTPGVDASVLTEFFARQRGTILGLYDLFAGGNLEKATIFALGIMPYISASIILQLFQAVIPYFEKLAKEGDEGRKKITQYTRYGTVVLSVIQAFGIAIFLENMTGPSGASAVMFPGMGFPSPHRVDADRRYGLRDVAGRADHGARYRQRDFAHYYHRHHRPLSDRRAEHVARRPAGSDVAVQTGDSACWSMVLVIGGDHFRHAGTTAHSGPIRQACGGAQGLRWAGEPSFRLSVNIAGVIPIIFAQSLIMFPGTLAAFFQDVRFCRSITLWLISPGTRLHRAVYGLIIIFFTYFYTAIVLNPVDLADNMKKSGGFIPGIRPGKRTAEYIDRILTRITLAGRRFSCVHRDAARRDDSAGQRAVLLRRHGTR